MAQPTFPRDFVGPAARHRMGLLDTVNAVALDAVMVGVAWQAWVGMEFGGNWPRPIESFILALTIWLIYTLDRLLDARGLNLDRPHTHRHGFHHRHRSRLLILWVMGLAVDATLVVRELPMAQLQWVIVGSAGVWAYLVAVHLVATPWMCKEAVIGPLFALGVFIPSFTTDRGSDIAVALDSGWLPVGLPAPAWGWAALSGLFILNCVRVAHHDRECDRQQAMPSVASGWRDGDRWADRMTFAYAGCVAAATWIGKLPLAFALTLAVSAMGMSVIERWSRRQPRQISASWFDFAILIAPLAGWWWRG